MEKEMEKNGELLVPGKEYEGWGSLDAEGNFEFRKKVRRQLKDGLITIKEDGAPFVIQHSSKRFKVTISMEKKSATLMGMFKIFHRIAEKLTAEKIIGESNNE